MATTDSFPGGGLYHFVVAVWKQNRQNPDAIWGYVFLAMEKMLGEWTKTELYPLLRASEVFPSDYYWDDETSKWRRLAELPCGKSVLATPAQRQMLTNRGLPWDEFTTKYQVQELIESRPCTDKQRAFMDDLGITHFDGMTTREASDLIDAELAKETPDGPATP